jgi:hypothetical protein
VRRKQVQLPEQFGNRRGVDVPLPIAPVRSLRKRAQQQPD